MSSIEEEAEPARRDLVFRVFVSSTFSDLFSERDALQREVFPRLQDYCRERGASFQAIDLRWGITEAAAIQHRTMEICIEELRRCQELSPRPNFIVLLGDRYGWRPLPPRVRSDEFDALLRVMSSVEQQRARSWYRRDDNADPSEDCLVSRGGDFAQQQTWLHEERSLRLLLLRVARQIMAPENPALDKYLDSATHQEIRNGALAAPKSEEHVFCYLRHIDDLPTDATAGPYQDFAGGGIDHEASGRLADLKCELSARLPPEHVHKYSATWLKSGPSTTHIPQLCCDVFKDLTAIISREIDDFDRRPQVAKERDTHARCALEHCRCFFGRDEELRQIADYLRSDEETPLVVLGPQGSGKTALLAKAWESAAGSGTAVIRCIGASPRSSDLHHLLNDVAQELGQGPSGLENDPLAVLLVAGANAARSGSVVVWLDGLDQLTHAHDAHLLRWFPVSLPHGVKLIASANVEAANIEESLARLRVRLPADSVIDVGQLTVPEGQRILEAWLDEARRKLQDQQHRALLTALASCPRPLLLRLGFEVARRWHSWEPPMIGTRDFSACGSISDALHGMLSWLEGPEKHGRLLTSRALGYLAVAREGLAEGELLDILSRDAQILDDVHGRSPDSPYAAILPPIIWYRLFRDVEFLLALRAVDDTKIIAFSHQAAAEVVCQRFLHSPEEERSCRAALADYFATQPCGPRKADELPWQLRAVEAWDRLGEVLAEIPLSEMVYQRHGPELVQYWAILKEQLGCDVGAVYRDGWQTALAAGTLPRAVSVVLANLGYAAEAESIIDAIVAWLREHANQSEDLASALSAKANFLEARHDHPQARKLFEEALTRFQSAGQKLDVAACLSDLAGTHFEQNPMEALRLLRDAETAWRDANCDVNVAACLGNQANVHMGLGNPQTALELQREAVRLCAEFKMPIPTAEHRASLGNMLAHIGQRQEALQNLRQAEKVFRDFGLVGPLGSCLGQMANLFAAQGDPQEAYRLNEEALGLLRGSPQHVWLATCLLNQARICLDLGRYQDGKRIAEEALEEIRLCSAPPSIRQPCLQLLFELRQRAARGH